MNFLVSSVGFISWHLINFLLTKGKVFVTGPCDNPVPDGAEIVAPRFQQVKFKFLPRIDCLFHLAACTNTLNFDKAHQTTTNCYEALDLMMDGVCHGCGHIVYASSAAVYGDTKPPQMEDDPPHPETPYASSKAKLEGFLGMLPWPTAGLRFSNVYGPREGHKGAAMSYVSQMVRQSQSTGHVKLYNDGSQRRDWLHVSDAVAAMWLAHEKRAKGIFNVGSGESLSFNEIADMLGAKVDYIGDAPQGFQTHTKLDLAKSRAVLGYEPKVNLVEGHECLARTPCR